MEHNTTLDNTNINVEEPPLQTHTFNCVFYISDQRFFQTKGQQLIDDLEKNKIHCWVSSHLEDILLFQRRKEIHGVLIDVMKLLKSSSDCLKNIRRLSQAPIITITDKHYGALYCKLIQENQIHKNQLFNPKQILQLSAQIYEKKETHKEKNRAELFLWDTHLNNVFFQNNKIHLTPTEFKILKLLYTHAEKPVSRDLIRKVLPIQSKPLSSRTIDVHINNIRRKLNDVSNQSNFIHSAYGIGYCFSMQ